MHFNTGEDFFHPVTHQLIKAGSYYEGSAHRDEESPVVASPHFKPDEVTPKEKQPRRK